MTARSMIVMQQSTVYSGPNLFASQAAVRFEVEIARSDIDDRGLASRVLEFWFAGISQGQAGSLAPPDTIPTTALDWASLVARLSVHLQNETTGASLRWHQASASSEPDRYDLCFDCEDPIIGLAAGILAIETLNGAAARACPSTFTCEDGFDLETAIGAFYELAQAERLTAGAAALFREARRRGIPAQLFHDAEIQLGQGSRRRLIHGSSLDIEAADAVDISVDKSKTVQILRDHGIPVPEQRRVETADQAVAAAESFGGGPVIVKPTCGDFGRAVSLRLDEPSAIRAAAASAFAHDSSAVVESYAAGNDYRLLILDGDMIAAAKRNPAHVVGDGKSSIRDLIDELNRDPRRAPHHWNVLTTIEIDQDLEDTIAVQGMTLGSVPKHEQKVRLRATPNLSTGGWAIDVTDDVHPDNREIAIRAARTMRLRLCGVDFISPDISLSYREVGGVVCEVNSGPGLRMHYAPSVGSPRDVAGRIVDAIYPDPEDARIPVAAITGTNGKTTTTRMVAHIARTAGSAVGMTTTDGAFVDDERVIEGEAAGANGAATILGNAGVEIAVLETARGGILESGLGFHRCTVAAVLNIDEDHIGEGGIETLEALAGLKRIVAEAADDTVVLNADDSLCVAMAASCSARHICYVTMASVCSLVEAHIAGGGRAVRLEDVAGRESIVLHDAGTPRLALAVSDLPATFDGRARHNVQNAMFAAAIAYGIGVSIEAIDRGLRDFKCSFALSPGRMNFFDGLPFRLLMDWAHNEPGFRTLYRTIKDVPVDGQRIGLMTVGGGRTDRQVMDIGRMMAGWFDHYVLYHWDDRFGRRPEEIPQLMKQGLIEMGVPANHVTLIPGESEALDACLRMARPGDFVVLVPYDNEEAWSRVQAFSREIAGRRSLASGAIT
ncbi:MAG: cyanophycin synthetase [Alphaproteobacteria bacterium]|nr:cyanophycin synthetase [Alphaproteobacteria bacterium]